ncbi:MAG: zinc-ribbon domain-containing protein [Bacteroidetes bacterium]|nr:zinc-ribbon domain-containing protein [Bacteroidota bacterium]
MKFCTKCGNPLKPYARFCGKCGEILTQVDSPVQPEPAATPVCKSCGTSLISDIKFCTVCGAKVQEPARIDPQPQVSKKPLPVMVRRPEQGMPVTKSKRKKKPWIIAGLLFVVVAGLTAAAWFFIFHKNTVIDTILPEYQIQKGAQGTTTNEVKEFNRKSGALGNVVLSDGSAVTIQVLKSDAKIKFARENNTINTGKNGVATSGSMRTLTIEGSGNIASLQPVITIPKSEAGSISPVTINMVRVSDIMCGNGLIMKDQVDYLPITLDKEGNYIAVDYLFSSTAPAKNNNTASADLTSKVLNFFIPSVVAAEPILDEVNWVASVKYCLSTFQGDVNWDQEPRLVQMMPDADMKTYFRRPSNFSEKENRTKPIVNVIILVHGHNEAEKGGNIPSQTQNIWKYSYKRNVWNPLYKIYLEKSQKDNTKNKKGEVNDCTVFYEFIYPTYRPIFTPLPKNSVIAYKTLGESFGEMIKDEFLNKNPQIAKMIKEKIPFNFYIVGHSMGGLVARAGLRYIENSPEIWNNFRQLITWGTPHQGSPVTTLRYITAAGFNIKIGDMMLYPYGDAPKIAVQYLVMDTPGTRDLRWTNGSKGVEKFFKYDMFFSAKNEKQEDNPELSIQTGSEFYNDNLKTFNETEHFIEKYTFLTGSTSKMAEVVKGRNFLTKAYYLIAASETAEGSYLINLLAGSDSYKPNDGVSPVYSQAGRGLFPQPKTVSVGDVDHQQFYEESGEAVAAKTFEVMNGISKCNCPSVENYKFEHDSITANLKLPMDAKPGVRIKGIKVVLENKGTKEQTEPSVDFEIKSNGNFAGELIVDKEDMEKETFSLVIEFKDKSEITYEDTPQLAGTWSVQRKFVATNLNSKIYGDQMKREQIFDLNFGADWIKNFKTHKEGVIFVITEQGFGSPGGGAYFEYRIQLKGSTSFTGTQVTQVGNTKNIITYKITGIRIK